MHAPPDETSRARELSDDELILYYYGETRRAEKIRRRLEDSPEAQERYDELCRVLAAVETLPVPEPADGYGERVWSRLRPRLEARQGLWKRLCAFVGIDGGLPRLATAGAVAALLAVAFLAGRFWSLREEELTFSDADRERIMVAAVADHLERSQRLLQDLANAPSGGLDVTFERASADDLLGANRLYRRTSQRSGEAGLAAVLDDLERLLLDLAHGPASISADDLEEFRSQIDDILFKVQVLGARLRQQQQPAPQGAFAPSPGDGNQA